MLPTPSIALRLRDRLVEGVRWVWYRIRRVPRSYFKSLAIQIAVAGFLIHDWDGFVFIISVHEFVSYGITPYETATHAPPYAFMGSMLQWYAYPPLPLLLMAVSYAIFYLFLLVRSPILQRIAIKLPMIAGNIVLAYVVRKFVGRYRPDQVPRAEKLVLYNPLLIIIAAVWGMFDVWIAVFTLVALILLLEKRVRYAGFATAAAILTKVSGVIFAPIFAAATYRWYGRGRAFSYLFSIAFLYVLASLYFLVRSPIGYIDQTVLVHVHRPPQEFAFLGLYLINQGVMVATRYALSPLGDLIQIFSYVFSGLLAGLILFLTFSAWQLKEQDARPLLFLLLTAAVGFTLFNKVVNPQYLVLPIGLAIPLLFALEPGRSTQLLKQYVRWFSYAFPAAIIILGWHYVTFVPHDVRMQMLSLTARLSELRLPIALHVPAISTGVSFHISRQTIEAIHIIIPALLAVPGFVYGIFLVRNQLSDLLSRWHSLRGRVFSVLAILLLVSPAAAFSSLALLSQRTTASPSLSAFNPGDKLVGCFYYYWWSNPTHNPYIRSGNWYGTLLTPAEGFYDINRGYIKYDLVQMKSVGIDFVVLSFHEYGFDRYLLFVDVAAEQGIHFAPMIELYDLREQEPELCATFPDGEPAPERQLGLKNATLNRIVEFILLSLRVKDNPAFLWYSVETQEPRPVVFLYDSFYFYPGWSDEEKRFVARALLDLYMQRTGGSEEQVYELLSARWESNIRNFTDLLANYPKDIKEFRNPITDCQKDWCDAFLHAWHLFWQQVKQRVEAEAGPVYWIGGDLVRWWMPPIEGGRGAADTYFRTFDTEFVYSPSLIWKFSGGTDDALRRYRRHMEILAYEARIRRRPIIQTVCPYYNDKLIRPASWFEIPPKIEDRYTYDIFWEIALSNDPDIVLIATWNEYYESTCIEPTVEFGDLFLQKTENWVCKFKQTSPSSIL